MPTSVDVTAEGFAVTGCRILQIRSMHLGETQVLQPGGDFVYNAQPETIILKRKCSGFVSVYSFTCCDIMAGSRKKLSAAK